ncbi:hypothetical protein VINE108521_15605 [Vibrio neonatus]
MSSEVKKLGDMNKVNSNSEKCLYVPVVSSITIMKSFNPHPDKIEIKTRQVFEQ